MLTFIVLISSLLLTACEVSLPKAPPNTGKYAPVINLQPKYFITISGYIDPALHNKVPLKIISTYYTTNQECRYVVDAFAGVSSYRQIRKIISVQSDELNQYQYTIPLDLYEPGFCGWTVSTIGYKTKATIPDYEAWNIASFSDKKASSIAYLGKDLWFCTKNSDCRLPINEKLQGNYDLSRDSSYSFEVILRRK